MKYKPLLVTLLLLGNVLTSYGATGANSAVDMNTINIMPVLPYPASSDIHYEECFDLTRIIIDCEELSSATAWTEKYMKEWYGEFAPSVVAGKSVSGISDAEAYSLLSDGSGVSVKARTLQGIRYAMFTLRQLVIPKRGTKTIAGYIIRKADIEDRPVSDFRGLHICWFPEVQAWEVERLIRLAAFFKMNYVVLEPWGTFRSDVAPWYGYPDGTMTKSEVKRLCGIAKDLGVTLIPQLNVFGHAALARERVGKHAALDTHPEYQPLFEPDNGWNFCLTNPETRTLIMDLIKELYDAFERPPFFHIGCDEAYDPSCPDCLKRPYSEILSEHITAVSETIVKMGARPMMWHDKLLVKGDQRWKGFTATGSQETAKLANTLPKDIVICDWCYKTPKEDYPTLKYFKGLGFDVLTCPFKDVKGMETQIKFSQKNGIGVLGTLWHHYFGDDLFNIYYHLSCMMWYGDMKDIPYRSWLSAFYTMLRYVCWDMKFTDYTRFGSFKYQVPPENFLNN
ncbi:MAG: family 20 glycosylhydrolase [Alistipes sp.]|nr:family 20 glycosylhydrolase [Candidatus Minthomonas equi]